MGFRKNTTSNYLQVDVRRLHRDGLLKPGMSYQLQWTGQRVDVPPVFVRVDFGRVIFGHERRRKDGTWQSEDYRVLLEWTGCHYGGRRPWFICPGKGCGRRVAVLYDGGVLACRRCYRLVYESQREASYLRALHRAQAIRLRLGGSANMTEPFPAKPTGMHWRTYRRLFQEAEDADGRSWLPWFPNQFGGQVSEEEKWQALLRVTKFGKP